MEAGVVPFGGTAGWNCAGAEGVCRGGRVEAELGVEEEVDEGRLATELEAAKPDVERDGPSFDATKAWRSINDLNSYLAVRVGQHIGQQARKG